MPSRKNIGTGACHTGVRCVTSSMRPYDDLGHTRCIVVVHLDTCRVLGGAFVLLFDVNEGLRPKKK